MADLAEHFDPDPRGGYEWGLAATLVGGVMSLIALITLILIDIVGTQWYPGRSDRWFYAIGGTAGGLFALAVEVAGMVFAVWAVVAARRHRQPIGLGLAGVLLNGFAVFVTLGAALAWYGTVLDRM